LGVNRKLELIRFQGIIRGARGSRSGRCS
jgi:hypothetical protein